MSDEQGAVTGSAGNLPPELAAMAAPPATNLPPLNLDPSDTLSEEAPPAAGEAPPAENAAPPPDNVQSISDFREAMAETAAATPPPDPHLDVIPTGAKRLTREEAQQRREEHARSKHREIWLPATGTLATVRDLPFTDFAVIRGIPTQYRERFTEVLKNQKAMTSALRGNFAGINEAIATMEKALDIANGMCISVFVSPRLVGTPGELDSDNPDVWLVDDIAEDDRIAVMNWIQRNRDERFQQEGGGTALAGFPGGELASTGN